MVAVCENCALQFFEALVHKFERAPGVPFELVHERFIAFLLMPLSEA
jgi:hypothetical protein